MEYGICDLAIVPLRAEPSDRSEQVSQLLFGEAFEITEWKDKWVKIVTAADKYTGWIDRLQFAVLDHAAYKGLLQTTARLTYKPVTQVRKISDNSILYLPAASSLSFLDGKTVYIGNQIFEVLDEFAETNDMIHIAESYLNVPYFWGGRTHFGIDCSGFTQAVYKMININLGRDAFLQAQDGALVDSLAKVDTGDLAFFGAEENRITHVGIMLNNRQIIHASGKVKIDTIDEEGIYSEELKRYTHKLRLIKRYD